MKKSMNKRQKELLSVYADKWIKIGTCTDTIDKELCKEAIDQVYKLGGLVPPSIYVFLESPKQGLIANYILSQHSFVGLESQVSAQVSAQIRAQVRDQVSDQVWDQVRDQISAQVSQVRDQVRDQVYDQVWAQVSAQIRNQVYAQVEAQVWAQVGAQVWNQVYAQVEAQVLDQVRDQVCFGYHSSWLSFYDYFQEVFNIDLKQINGLILAAKSMGWFWPFENIVIITNRPKEVHLKNKILHNESGPSISYRDGFSIWSLNGTAVPQWLVETEAHDIDPQKLTTLKNAQIRAEFVRKVGLERCWHKLAKIVDTLGEYELGDLPLEENRRGRYLKMHNTSVPELWHIEGVSNECNTVREALRWRQPDWMRDLIVDEKDGVDWYQQGDVCIVPKGATCIKEFPEILT